jgi:hypothetical protein
LPQRGSAIDTSIDVFAGPCPLFEGCIIKIKFFVKEKILLFVILVQAMIHGSTALKPRLVSRDDSQAFAKKLGYLSPVLQRIVNPL